MSIEIKESLTNQTNLNSERQYNAQSRIIQAVATIQQEQGKLSNRGTADICAK